MVGTWRNADAKDMEVAWGCKLKGSQFLASRIFGREICRRSSDHRQRHSLRSQIYCRDTLSQAFLLSSKVVTEGRRVSELNAQPISMN